MMLLYQYSADHLERTTDQSIDQSTLKAVCTLYRQRKLDCATQHAAPLADYREVYGYKMAIPTLYHSAALKLFVLLLESQARYREHMHQGLPVEQESSCELDSAFQESFHCLGSLRRSDASAGYCTYDIPHRHTEGRPHI